MERERKKICEKQSSQCIHRQSKEGRDLVLPSPTHPRCLDACESTSQSDSIPVSISHIDGETADIFDQSRRFVLSLGALGRTRWASPPAAVSPTRLAQRIHAKTKVLNLVYSRNFFSFYFFFSGMTKRSLLLGEGRPSLAVSFSDGKWESDTFFREESWGKRRG